MQDTAQKPDQNTTAPPAASPAQPVAPQDDNDIATPPVISINKEHGPMVTSAAESPAPEISAPETDQSEINPSTPPEIKIPSELKNVVEKSPDENNIKISKEVASAGVTPAAESSPVITTPTGSIKLPMTYSQARQKAKSTRLMDSAHWLAEMIMYEWLKHEPDQVREQKNIKPAA